MSKFALALLNLKTLNNSHYLNLSSIICADLLESYCDFGDSFYNYVYSKKGNLTFLLFFNDFIRIFVTSFTLFTDSFLFYDII